MERRYYKALNFDLDTHKLQEEYLGRDYHKAYYDVRNFLKAHRFEHRQGSGYLSEDKMSSADIFDLLDEMEQELGWIGSCVKKLDVTNIGQQYDLVYLFRI